MQTLWSRYRHLDLVLEIQHWLLLFSEDCLRSRHCPGAKFSLLKCFFSAPIHKHVACKGQVMLWTMAAVSHGCCCVHSDDRGYTRSLSKENSILFFSLGLGDSQLRFSAFSKMGRNGWCPGYTVELTD